MITKEIRRHLRLEGFHTYYVSEKEILVHNLCEVKTTKTNYGKLGVNSEYDGGSKSIDVYSKLIDGSSMKTDDVLDLASDYLGDGYTEPVPGSGRFVSADGTRVFRMGENDILGRHGGGPHVNFEFLGPNPSKPGKMQVVKDIHIYLED